MACSKAVLTFVVILLIAGICAMAVGAIGSFWYLTDANQSHIGMWKKCEKNVSINPNELTCSKRKNILQFSYDAFNGIDNQAYDIVLMLVVMAGGLGCISLIFALSMCCVQRTTTWRTVAAAIGMLSFTSVTASVLAVIFAELKIRRELSFYAYGWASIVTWIGCGSFILAFLMIVTTCCLPPDQIRKRRKEAYEMEVYKSNYNTLNNNSRGNTLERKESSNYENVGFNKK